MQVLGAGCKIVKGVLFLQQVPMLPPIIAIVTTAPALTFFKGEAPEVMPLDLQASSWAALLS